MKFAVLRIHTNFAYMHMHASHLADQDNPSLLQPYEHQSHLHHALYIGHSQISILLFIKLVKAHNSCKVAKSSYDLYIL